MSIYRDPLIFEELWITMGINKWITHGDIGDKSVPPYLQHKLNENISKELENIMIPSSRPGIVLDSKAMKFIKTKFLSLNYTAYNYSAIFIFLLLSEEQKLSGSKESSFSTEINSKRW